MAQAFEIAGNDITILADADLSTKQFYAVKLSNDGQAAVAGAGEAAIGVLQNKPDAAGKAATVRVSGVTRMVAGGVVNPGDRVAADASGKAKTAVAGKTDTSDAGAAADALIGSFVIGRYLGTAACADGDLIPVLVTLEGAVPTTAA